LPDISILECVANYTDYYLTEVPGTYIGE
jgi:hypothetical protein